MGHIAETQNSVIGIVTVQSTDRHADRWVIVCGVEMREISKFLTTIYRFIAVLSFYNSFTKIVISVQLQNLFSRSLIIKIMTAALTHNNCEETFQFSAGQRKVCVLSPNFRRQTVPR